MGLRSVRRIARANESALPSGPRRAGTWLTALVALAVASFALGGASCSSTKAPTPAVDVHPRVLLRPADLPVIQSRLDTEPYRTIWQGLTSTCARDFVAPDAGTWPDGTWSRNMQTARACAFVGWVNGDQASSAKARTILLSLDPDFSANTNLDADIALPGILIPAVDAWDLLSATKTLSPDDSREAERRITEVTRQFTARYLDPGIFQTASFVVTQNNHPLRAAGAVGTVALAFPDDPDAASWLAWSVDQIDYLLGPKGHYVQDDGAVSEGPFYHSFGFSGYLPFLVALDHLLPDGTSMTRTCITRNDKDPWSDSGCVEGETYAFTNPLHGDRLQRTLDWSLALRRPTGSRAILGDAKMRTLSGPEVLTSWGAPAYHAWDWQDNPDFPFNVGESPTLHLAYGSLDGAAPPPWRNRFFPSGGHAAFRSGWGPRDLWLLLVADGGPARKSIHNHADGTSFALSAYGEQLLIDTGYYKPNALANALTCESPAHNVLLIDGQGAPMRGLLNDWGDTDAFLENTHDGVDVAFAEARMDYQSAELRRGLSFARQRYFVVADRISDTSGTARTYQWRAHLWAGFDVDGTYALAGNRVHVDRPNAGLEIASTTTAGDPTFVEPPFVSLQVPHVHQFEENTSTARNHAVADATITATAPQFLTVLAPYATGGTGGEAPLTVTSAGSGAWTIAGAGFADVAWIRDGASSTMLTVGAHVIETDGAFVHLSLDGAWALVSGGSYVKLDGNALVTGNVAPVAVVP